MKGEVVVASSIGAPTGSVGQMNIKKQVMAVSGARVLSIFRKSSKLVLRSSPLRAMASSQSVAPGNVEGTIDFGQLIQAHQAAAARLPLIEEVRTLLDCNTRGMLSTFSEKHQGYPSGSMVDFACDHDGSPLLAVSSLAVHTKDLLANPKCSLLVAKDPADRTDLVITLHGDAISVSESNREAVRTAYLRKHLDAFWVDFGDFQFIRIEPKVVRYVSGVATALLGSGEFGVDEFKAAKVDPISQFSAPVAVDFAHMLDLDSLGFYVKAGYQGTSLKLRIPFPRRAENRKDVKTLIVEMLQAAKASGRAT